MAVHRDLAGLTDVELASLAAAGGQAAFGVLTIRHAAKVRGLLRRMGAQPPRGGLVSKYHRTRGETKEPYIHGVCGLQ